MKKREKGATKQSKQPLKDLRVKAASAVRGGTGPARGTLKWSNIELKG